jgi:hypothetical protein
VREGLRVFLPGLNEILHITHEFTRRRVDQLLTLFRVILTKPRPQLKFKTLKVRRRRRDLARRFRRRLHRVQSIVPRLPCGALASRIIQLGGFLIQALTQLTQSLRTLIHFHGGIMHVIGRLLETASRENTRGADRNHRRSHH